MTEARYWLRHPTLAGHVGPLHRADLEAAVKSGSLPLGGEALRDEGQDQAARERAAWTKVTELLGLPPIVEARQSVQQGATLSGERAFLLERRRRTAYAPLRWSIDVAAALLAILQLVTLIPWPSQFGRLSFAIFCEFVASIAVLIVLRGLLHLVVDLADGRLSRDRSGKPGA